MDAEPRTDTLVIVGCCREKTVTSGPVPALDLYQGWCVPMLRDYAPAGSGLRAGICVLSARYGLISADEPAETYEQPLTARIARELRPRATAQLAARLREHPVSAALLLVAPDYLELLGPLPLPEIHTITDPTIRPDAVRRVLSAWRWPCPYQPLP